MVHFRPLFIAFSLMRNGLILCQVRNWLLTTFQLQTSCPRHTSCDTVVYFVWRSTWWDCITRTSELQGCVQLVMFGWTDLAPCIRLVGFRSRVAWLRSGDFCHSSSVPGLPVAAQYHFCNPSCPHRICFRSGPMPCEWSGRDPGPPKHNLVNPASRAGLTRFAVHYIDRHTFSTFLILKRT